MNQKNLRAERPDKPLFFAMTGAFFLLFAVAPAYWAFYNFGEYRQTKTFVEELKTKPEPFLTTDEKNEKESRIFFLSARRDRYRLEMLLSGGGSFALFGIALVLFGKALKAQKRKNYYHEIDWRTTPVPARTINVRYKKTFDVLFALIVLFFGGILLPVIYQIFTSRFFGFGEKILRSAIFVGMLLFLSLFLFFLMFRARRKAVRSIDASGVLRNDGKHFAWSEFCGVVIRKALNPRTQNRYIWREELAFSGGETAWLIPNRVKNADEVFAFIDALPQAVLKEVK